MRTIYRYAWKTASVGRLLVSSFPSCFCWSGFMYLELISPSYLTEADVKISFLGKKEEEKSKSPLGTIMNIKYYLLPNKHDTLTWWKDKVTETGCLGLSEKFAFNSRL